MKFTKCILLFVAIIFSTKPLFAQDGPFKPFYNEYINPRPYSYNFNQKDIAAGDFNEDGYNDIAIVGHYFSDVELGIRFGTCNGMVRDSELVLQNTLMQQYPSLVVGDVNGDSHEDVIISALDLIAVYEGDGLGNFASPIYSTMPFLFPGVYYKTIAASDFNHDGFFDIIITGLSSYSIGTNMSTYVAYGNVNGMFTVSNVNYSMLDNYAFYGHKCIADVNHDGWDDVVTTYGNVQYNQNGVIDSISNIGLSLPNIVPIPQINDISVLQSDADSAMEIYFTSDSALFFGELNTVTMPLCVKIAVSNKILGLAVGDFDGDGFKDDVVLELDNNTARFYRGNGTTLVYESSAKLSSLQGHILADDINNDGRDDIFNTNDQNVNVCLGQFRFVNDNYIPLNGIPKYICHADIDQDGYDDIVSVSNSASGALNIAYGNYCGLSEVKDYAGAVQFKEVKTGKFNSDSLPDIIVSSNLYDSVYIYLNTGNRTFAAPVGYYVAHHFVQLSIADFNEDGIDDAFMLSTSPVVYNMIYGDPVGNGTLTGATANQSAATISVYGADPEVADFNNDGHKDVSISHDNALGQRVTILFGDGAGNFPLKTPYSFGPSSVYCAPMHLNADSIVDMISSSGISTQAIYFMCNDLNASTWSYNCSPPLSFSSYSLTVGDFNNDSINDFIANGLSYAVLKAAPYVLKPDYSIQDMYVSFDEGTNKSELADLNGAGFMDLAFYNTNSLVLYKNSMPGNPSLMLMNDTLFSAPQRTTTSPSIIEWYKDHVKIANATQMYLPVTAIGLYQLAYTYPDYSVVTAAFNVTSLSSGIEENGIVDVSVFPNPASDQISVNRSNGNVLTYWIMDAIGRKKIVGKMEGEGTVIISLKDISSGLYFICLTDQKGNRTTKKMVKL